MESNIYLLVFVLEWHFGALFMKQAFALLRTEPTVEKGLYFPKSLWS